MRQRTLLEILRVLDFAKVKLSLRDGKVMASPKAALTDDIRDLLKSRKPAIERWVRLAQSEAIVVRYSRRREKKLVLAADNADIGQLKKAPNVVVYRMRELPYVAGLGNKETDLVDEVKYVFDGEVVDFAGSSNTSRSAQQPLRGM